MTAVSKAVILLVFIIALTSCSAFAPKPTETPVPTTTSSSTWTPTPTSTPEPTATSTPTVTPTRTPVPPTETPSVPGLRMPVGTPLANWEGFPIMPGALAGDGDGKSYSFTLQASPEEIQKYYEKELAKLGWNMFAIGEGGNQTLLLIFMKGTDTLSVSVLPQAGDIVYVMLVK